jgi:alpha-beta hydrolase superfamily lysophospholipase
MNAITVQPQKSGFRIQRFKVETADHLTLQAMVVEPTSASGSTARGQVIVKALKKQGLARAPGHIRGTLVLLHGYNARKEHMLTFAERFCAAGFRCVLYDSRGHGDSGGEYATFGTHERDDLHRVLEAARPLAGQAGFGPLGLMGYSMGGAVALQAQPGLPEVKALATVSTFADFRDVIQAQAGKQWHGLGRPLLPLIRQETRLKAGFDPWDIRPMEAAQNLTCPLFLAQGSDDALVPGNQIHLLAAAAGPQLRQAKVIPGGTHGSIFIAGGDSLWTDLVLFFVRELKP